MDFTCPTAVIECDNTTQPGVASFTDYRTLTIPVTTDMSQAQFKIQYASDDSVTVLVNGQFATDATIPIA